MPSQRAQQLDNCAGFLSWLLVQSHGRPLLNERWAGAALLCGCTFLAFALLLLLLLPHYIGMSELTELASRAVAALRDPVPMELLIHFHRALPAVSYKVPFLHPVFSVRCVWGEGGGDAGGRSGNNGSIQDFVQKCRTEPLHCALLPTIIYGQKCCDAKEPWEKGVWGGIGKLPSGLRETPI